MNQIKDLVESLGLDEDKAKKLMETAKENPMAAMAMVGELGITPDKIQALMQAVMQNPDLLKNVASQFGLNDELVSKVKGQFSKKED